MVCSQECGDSALVKMSEDFTPRNYQVELMKIGLEKNTIIFLPTGSGKTFIALMILKRMSGSLLQSYSNGGKITMILVNTVALVEQHAKYVKDHTPFSVGQYSGDMNIDSWPKELWLQEFEQHQVLIMTSQILVNLVVSSYIDLNNVNLIIFDECHRGVNDHCMRQLMRSFENLVSQPRVIGLTATLLNRNCSTSKVLDEVMALEVTYHSKVATVEGLSEVVGFSTNPREHLRFYHEYSPNDVENNVLANIKNLVSVIEAVKVDSAFLNLNLSGLKTLDNEPANKNLVNLVKGLVEDVDCMGTYGGIKAIISYAIQIERLKRQCQDLNQLILLNYIQTVLSFCKEMFARTMENSEEKDRVFRHSSDKVVKLLNIFQEYKQISKEDLCCIIFTKKRFTAKIIYHILDSVSQCHPDFAFLKVDYMVGYNNNPYNSTREHLFCNKKNRQALKNFETKEINVIVASSVLEEGVDIPKCTLVIRFDKSEDYRSYIQSKGRARHKESLFYMLIDRPSGAKYIEKYNEFQVIEETLNNYLVGKNLERQGPSETDIQKMYHEDELPPYYVDGVGSAQVNMLTSISLLCQYCASLPSDLYTTYAPEWYIQNHMIGLEKRKRVIIYLPTVCPILDPIEGQYMKNTKSAKRAAALRACTILHKAGELDEHLLPKKCEVPEEDVSFLFKHYPAVKEPTAGSGKMRRLHKKQISGYVRGKITPDTEYFLHVIELEPHFSRQLDNIHDAVMYDTYTSSTSFGILSLKPLPHLCDFPIYVTSGTLTVKLKLNATTVFLDERSLSLVKTFQYNVFHKILDIKHSFIMFDSSEDAEALLLVPIDKENATIRFDILKDPSVRDVIRPSNEEKLHLEVSAESYFKKIISPWYRRESATYIVTEVNLNKSALTEFPNEDFTNYQEYFEIKHTLNIWCPDLPLLQVKGLTKRLNFIKPKGKQAKRKRDKIFEEMTEHLLPELVVKQEFPSSLWIQASFLPTILSRMTFMLQLEELRHKIARETGLNTENVSNQPPLTLDQYLLDYSPYVEEESPFIELPNLEETDLSVPFLGLRINQDFQAKLLESEYPWKDIDEPKDILRHLEVNVMDIEYYESFVSTNIDSRKDFVLKNTVQKQAKQLALTYYENFVPKPIELFERPFSKASPSISDLYRALTTAKAHEIVNLERLETLGDSFLKLISTIYVNMRFPKYNEGRLTSLKSRIVSNKNLYYLAEKKNLGGIMKYCELIPKDEWLPPATGVPREMLRRIDQKEVSINALFNLTVPSEEQVSGEISNETLQKILELDQPPDDTEESSYSSMACFLQYQYVGDKHVADVVESILGVYFQSCGFLGGVKFVEWMGILPRGEIEVLLSQPPTKPTLNRNTAQKDIDFHIPSWRAIEETLGYTFNDRGYLLQAMTHSSYTPNRLTLSYEKLEFLGDALLDFLITCHIYESCGNLDPGQLTDLRSALVNNNTFASLVVRCNFQKFLLMMNSKLQTHIDRFVNFLSAKDFQIDDEVLILLEENELNLAEYVDVPKVLGDIFEALAGAVYLDSGKDLKAVWRVFYKIMWREIDLFSHNVPKNIVRQLFETQGIECKFGKSVMNENRCFIPLQFLHNGRHKLVHGCGSNKVMAKKAAAKLALRTLQM